jgi:hypothetical protein
MRSKKVQGILMAVVISAMIVSVAPLQAQAGTVASSALSDPAALQCVVNALIADLGAISACADDGACKANAAVDMVLDVLLCINPENNNVELLSCILGPLTKLSQINATCGTDRWCRIQKTIAVSVEFMTCLKNYQGTTN